MGLDKHQYPAYLNSCSGWEKESWGTGLHCVNSRLTIFIRRPETHSSLGLLISSDEAKEVFFTGEDNSVWEMTKDLIVQSLSHNWWTHTNKSLVLYKTKPYRTVHSWALVSKFFPSQKKNKGHFSQRSYVYSSVLWSTSHKNMLILMNSVSAIRIHISLYIHMPLCKLR